MHVILKITWKFTSRVFDMPRAEAEPSKFRSVM